MMPYLLLDGFALLQELEQSCRTKRALQEVQVPQSPAVSDVDAVGDSLQDVQVPLSDGLSDDDVDMDRGGAASGGWIPDHGTGDLQSPKSPESKKRKQ